MARADESKKDTRKSPAEHRRVSWLIAGFTGAWTGLLLFYPVVLVLALGDGDLATGWASAAEGGLFLIIAPGLIHLTLGPVPIWAVMAWWLGRQDDRDPGAAPATLVNFGVAVLALVLAQVLVVGVADLGRVVTSPQMLANIGVLAVIFLTYRIRLLPRAGR
ncbi:hypothetical protein A8B78_09265 [Jannaschia sp. EhC01]|nr:hypothetical protein A8B78_09265 [Jannaschia sp. EhC01]